MGDKLISVNGEDLIIEDYRIELTEEPVSVYNFQVDDYHTYFVGDCAVWVHNAEGCGRPFTNDQQKLIKEAKNANKNGGMTRTEANDFVQRSHKAGLNAEIH